MEPVSWEGGRGYTAEISSYCGKNITAASNNRVFRTLRRDFSAVQCYDLAELLCQGCKKLFWSQIIQFVPVYLKSSN